MEMGGLGRLNSLVQNKSLLQSETKPTGFAALFCTVTQDISPSNLAECVSGVIDSNNVNDTIKFLKQSDLLGMEEGFKLADIAMTTELESLFKAALKVVGMESEQLEGFTFPDLVDLNEADVEKQLEDMTAFLGALLLMPEKQLVMSMDKQQQAVLKAIKLFDLLSQYKAGDGSEGKLKDALLKIADKLEAAVQNKDAGRMESIQAKFKDTAAQINDRLSKESIQSKYSGAVRSGAGEDGKLILHGQFLSRPEQLQLMQGNASKLVDPQQLLRQFESALASSKFSNDGGIQKLAFRLFPEHLGSIRIELIQKEHGFIARIITTTSTAKETLDAHLNGLKTAFTSQNLQIDKIEVTQPESSQQRPSHRESGQEKENREQNRPRTEQEQEEVEPISSFDEILTHLKV
ncbi:flagellar hook-length control protein FliK [Bacillus massilinigeriensis]|uniref:flagellar hook-length control protein FliK n=1 Tax=Bacillus mediterraneensis TaxID=1805474 RepID=UPI0008F97603|nr:flagellar hook-length control protein FliK [Bacillus mediterraneensis]